MPKVRSPIVAGWIGSVAKSTPSSIRDAVLEAIRLKHDGATEVIFSRSDPDGRDDWVVEGTCIIAVPSWPGAPIVDDIAEFPFKATLHLREWRGESGGITVDLLVLSNPNYGPPP